MFKKWCVKIVNWFWFQIYGEYTTAEKEKLYNDLGNGDVFTGLTITKGSMSQPTKLYPVDASRIDRTTTFHINFK